MTQQATVTLKTGAKVIVTVTTIKLRTMVQATIAYRSIRIVASGSNESSAIKAAHDKFLHSL